jgi:ribosomal protein S18 acetylase RimI-like enzyme
MREEITIRRAGLGDVAALVSFNQAMAQETEDLWLDKEQLTAGVTTLLENDRHGFYLIAEQIRATQPEPVGSLMVTYEWSDWRNGLLWWIQSVYVMPEHRRRGIYRRLYHAVKAKSAADPGIRGFRLYVDKRNRIAQKTYERLGMTETHYMMFEELVRD